MRSSGSSGGRLMCEECWIALSVSLGNTGALIVVVREMLRRWKVR